jgi:hypothetical protein
MVLKFQSLVPGEQPNITANGKATMRIPSGPRLGVLYAELSVTKAAGGGGVTSLPLLTDIAHPTLPVSLKIDGREQRSRLATELIRENTLQDWRAAGSVQYFQAGVLVATVNNAANTSYAGLGLAANMATTAVFQLPFYLAEYWRKDIATGEGLAWPTSFSDGTVLPALTVEIPIANNGGGAFSGWSCVFWMDYDGIQWPATTKTASGNSMTNIVRQSRTQKLYATVGDVAVPIQQKDQLMQFSVVLAAGDVWSRCIVKKNGTVIRDVTPARNLQLLLDHGMNVAAVVPNICDIVMDLNDDTNASLPLNQNDTFEVTLTLATVAGSALMTVLQQHYGLPI